MAGFCVHVLSRYWLHTWPLRDRTWNMWGSNMLHQEMRKELQGVSLGNLLDGSTPQTEPNPTISTDSCTFLTTFRVLTLLCSVAHTYGIYGCHWSHASLPFCKINSSVGCWLRWAACLWKAELEKQLLVLFLMGWGCWSLLFCMQIWSLSESCCPMHLVLLPLSTSGKFLRNTAVGGSPACLQQSRRW